MISELFEHIPVIPQPTELSIKLYQHQLASIFQLEKREKEQQVVYDKTVMNTTVSVNADMTGYGKTLSMITMIYRNKMEWNLSEEYKQSIVTTYAEGRIKRTTSVYYEKLDITLVLVSQSIINQWYEECQKTPLCVKMVTTKKLIDTLCIKNYDIILVTPTMYNSLVLKYKDFAWKRFIFDEPGHLKIPNMVKVIAGFIWLVTATPNLMIAKHKNCSNSFMYDLVCYAGWCDFTVLFDYMIIKNSDDFVKYSFAMPHTNHLYYKCYNPIYSAINGLVTSKIIDMISADNIEVAIKALGGIETDNITDLIREKKNQQLILLRNYLNIYTEKNNTKQIQKTLTSIKRVENQLQELNLRYIEILNGDCSICLCAISNPVLEPNCQNIFCGACLLKWMETKTICPLCRDTIKHDQLIYIKSESNKNTKPLQKTKSNTIINIIKNNKEGKFIIFSAWDKTFETIRKQLEDNFITFIEVKGTVEERQKNITSFKKGDIQVIFLNSNFNGAGINLQEATDIIIYHNMNDHMLNQVIGRANRIGRSVSLDVHHLEI